MDAQLDTPLMVQKSGIEQLRLLVEIPLFTTGFTNIQTVVGIGISEPSTAVFQFKHDIHHWFMMFLNMHIS